jgi:hypothetical protein
VSGVGAAWRLIWWVETRRLDNSAEADSKSLSQGQSPRRRSLLIRLGFVGLSLILALLLVELIGRLVLRGVADDARYMPRLEQYVLRSGPILEPLRQPGQFDEKFGYVLSPNQSFTDDNGVSQFHQQTNSLGFFTREIEPREPGEYRVLLVGDSFFYGSYILDRERLGAQLEALAESDPSARRGLKVYNFARPGYCGVQELLVARTYAPQVEPDAVILGVFAANDAIANALTRIDDQERYVPVPEQVARYQTELRNALGPIRWSIIGRVAALTTPFNTRLYYQIARQPWVLDRNEELLAQFRAFCQERGYRFGVVFQHTNDSLDTGLRSLLFDAARLNDALAERCERVGVPFLEMREVFRQAGDWRTFIHDPPDSHPNALGTRLTAKAIYQKWIQPELARPVEAEPSEVRASGRSGSN